MNLRNLLLLLLCSASLVSCKSTKEDETITPADTLYSKGTELLQHNKHKDAAHEFAKIYFQHPGSEFAAKAEIMEAYSFYLAAEYEEAIDVLDTFVNLHPMHEDIAYVYYLKGMCYYMQISDAEHDQGKTDAAQIAFQEVINRFPLTKYAVDASLKMDLIKDHLAGSEMNVGRFYLKQQNPIAAVKRFQNVVQNYQTTSHIAEALYRMTECYMMLGIKDEAAKYAAVLGHNYPDSQWYEHAHRLVSKHK
jgi:outer membrane protein assembly factor BamD